MKNIRILIDEIKKKFKDSVIVVVTSTLYTQRGELSILTKEDKTKVETKDDKTKDKSKDDEKKDKSKDDEKKTLKIKSMFKSNFTPEEIKLMLKNKK